MEVPVSGHVARIDLGLLPDGLYLIRADDETFRVVKTKG
jgi:hypothetical protein